MVVPGFPPKSYYMRTCSNYNSREALVGGRKGGGVHGHKLNVGMSDARLNYPAIIIGNL